MIPDEDVAGASIGFAGGVAERDVAFSGCVDQERFLTDGGVLRCGLRGGPRGCAEVAVFVPRGEALPGDDPDQRVFAARGKRFAGVGADNGVAVPRAFLQGFKADADVFAAVFSCSALWPMATSSAPAVPCSRAWLPRTVMPVPVLLAPAARNPTATLLLFVC
jgi:hypothetical protein